MIGQNIKSAFSNGVAIPSLIIILGVTVFCGVFPDRASETLNVIQHYIVENLGWTYIILFAIYIIFIIFLAVSKLGNIRLGSDYTKPRYSFFTWTAMLFAAGMGIGLMFFGVAETISHYANPAIQGLDQTHRAKYAQAFSFLHWGFHGWAVYGLVALALAYFRYRYKLPLAIRSGFYPLLKERIHGRIGDVIDIFALCSTVFGIGTTLGYGVLQINAGLQSVGLVTEVSFTHQALITCVFIFLALMSTISGLDKGVKLLSQINMLLAIALLVFILSIGPTRYIIGTFSEGIGFYLSKLAEMTFNTYAYEPESQKWFASWTIFYWAWWIAWAPFVGLFIARISKGRTIREFVLGVVFIPSLFNFFWMTTFGSSAVWIDQHQAAGGLSDLADQVELLLFSFFEYLPMTGLLKGIALVMIVVFFVTSADSGIMVISSIASGGREKQPRWLNIFWGGLLLVLSLSMLRSGGLPAVQTLTLITALPFGIILAVLCYCLWLALRTDVLFRDSELPYGSLAWRGEFWRQRLKKILSFRRFEEVDAFLDSAVAEAFRELHDEFVVHGIEAHINRGVTGKGSCIEIIIPYDRLKNFTYGVFAEPRDISERFATEENAPAIAAEQVYVPLTYFNDGRVGYDIQYLTKDEIIADVLREYGRFIDIVSNENTEILVMDSGRPT